MKLFGFALILVALAGSAFGTPPVGVPEIDGSSVLSAVTLVTGSLLVLRSRRKK